MSTADLAVRPARRPAARRRDPGQATVELALCLPLVVVLALGVCQVLLVARDQLQLESAARDGARAAAVSARPEAAAAAVVAAATGGAGRVRVATVSNGERVTVRVTASVTALPFVGAAVRHRELTASATMLVEPPDDG